jgi:hypothetical protein
MTTEAQRQANKRYRLRNPDKCRKINCKAILKKYNEDETYRTNKLSYVKEHYQKNRNYRDIDNIAAGASPG